MEYSSFFLLKNLIILLQDTINNDLNIGMPGLDLAATFPTNANQLPTIVVSFSKVKKKVIGIGGVLEVERQLNQDNKVIKADRIEGEMNLQIWIADNNDFDPTKIDDTAKLLGELFISYKNELRVNNGRSLLKNKLNHIGPIVSSENQPVWFIQGGKAYGRRLVYDFVYEYSKEVPAEGIVKKVEVKEIWLDDTLLSESMVIPNE